LAKAQLLRARGQYKACAQLYHRLRSEFPGSEEARVSMVSLGELELVETKNPVAALDAFNAYLHLGGPLEREARFGKIRALRALERRHEADAETARFLRDYPTSIHAATLRRKSYGQ
jgi:outer membrane protein assembly factor BamD (BamD/ComL family)